MTDELVKRLRNKTRDSILKENDRVEAADRIEQLTAERDAAYASGYSDAETEISKSALGESNAFLHSQYANAAEQIKDLNELLDEAQTEWSKYASSWMTAEGKLADAEALIEAQAKDHASNNIRFAEAEHRAKTAEAERDRLREALTMIDAIDPEHHIDGCAQAVVRGLVLRMGETARAALKGKTP